MPDNAEIHVLTRVAEWDAIEADWTRLHESSPGAATTMRFGWLRNWWDIYGGKYGGERSLSIITVWQGKELLGLLPLYQSISQGVPVGVRTLRFVSTGEAQHEETCPEYLDLLCRAGYEELCLDCVGAEILKRPWDLLELQDLPADSAFARRMKSAPLSSTMRVIARGACPIADLRGGFESYLSRLSANSRQQMRRLLRESNRHPAVLKFATVANANEVFADLIRLHQQRWNGNGEPGCFVSRRFTEFHRRLLAEWIASERVVLASLEVHGLSVAVLYGFVGGDKFDFYQSGIQIMDGGALKKPGILAHLLLMQELSKRGVTKYDFLRGTSAYKSQLTTETRELVSISAWRKTPRTALYRLMKFGGRAARRALRW